MKVLAGPNTVSELAAPDVSTWELVRRLERKPELLESLIAAVSGEPARIRFAATKLLRTVSERAPDLLYPHFDFFTAMLRHDNSIFRWNAALIIGKLARVDSLRRVDQLLETYLQPITGPHLIDAANTMKGAASIAAAKPYLANRIAAQMLRVERATFDSAECRNIAVGHALTALEEMMPLIEDKQTVQRFARRQTENTRASTRAKASRFLKKWPLPAAAAHA